LLSSKTFRQALEPKQPPIQGVSEFLPRDKPGRGVMVITDLNLAQELRMKVAIPLLPLHALKA